MKHQPEVEEVKFGIEKLVTFLGIFIMIPTLAVSMFYWDARIFIIAIIIMLLVVIIFYTFELFKIMIEKIKNYRVMKQKEKPRYFRF